MVPLGENHLRAAIRAFTDHYHDERPHPGNELSAAKPTSLGLSLRHHRLIVLHEDRSFCATDPTKRAMEVRYNRVRTKPSHPVAGGLTCGSPIRGWRS
jgi:hypothetical protein